MRNAQSECLARATTHSGRRASSSVERGGRRSPRAPFFHNGAFTTVEEAVAHHLDPRASAKNYTPVGRLPADLTGPLGPLEPVLDRLDPQVRRPIRLTRGEFAHLVAFVRTGLLDPRATPANLAKLIPPKLPSELQPLEFELDD